MTQIPILFGEFQALPDRIKPGLKTLTNQLLTAWLCTLDLHISNSPLSNLGTAEGANQIDKVLKSVGKLLNIQKDFVREITAQGGTVVRPGDLGWKEKVIESLWIADERFTGLSYQKTLERDLIMREIQSTQSKGRNIQKFGFDDPDSRLTTQADEEMTWRPELPSQSTRMSPVVDLRPVETERTRIVMLPPDQGSKVKVPPLLIDNRPLQRPRVPDSPDQQINFDFASTSNRQIQTAPRRNLSEPQQPPPIMNGSFGPPEGTPPPVISKPSPPPPATKVVITDKPTKDQQRPPERAGIFGPQASSQPQPPPIQQPAVKKDPAPPPVEDPKSAIAAIFRGNSSTSPPIQSTPSPIQQSQPAPPPLKKTATKESNDSDSEDIDMQAVFGGMRKRQNSNTARNSRGQRLPRTVEKSDLVIKNESLYFEGFRSTRVDITDADAFKLAVNPYTLDVMVGGLNGLTFFHFNPETGLTKERFAQKNSRCACNNRSQVGCYEVPSWQTDARCTTALLKHLVAVGPELQRSQAADD